MYREISRTNGKTKRSLYGLTVAQRRLNRKGLVALPKANSPAAAGNESEALVAAISFGTLVIISLACLVRVWL